MRIWCQFFPSWIPFDWQFSRPARLLFPSGASRPTGIFRTHRMQVKTIFVGLPGRRSLTPRVSPSRVPVLSCAHYLQAPATQASKPMKAIGSFYRIHRDLRFILRLLFLTFVPSMRRKLNPSFKSLSSIRECCNDQRHLFSAAEMVCFLSYLWIHRCKRLRCFFRRITPFLFSKLFRWKSSELPVKWYSCGAGCPWGRFKRYSHSVRVSGRQSCCACRHCGW